MNYTIASLEDAQGAIIVDFSRDGTRYSVGIYHKITKEATTAKYDALEEAYSVFEKLSKAIITGCYSYKQRKEFLR